MIINGMEIKKIKSVNKKLMSFIKNDSKNFLDSKIKLKQNEMNENIVITRDEKIVGFVTFLMVKNAKNKIPGINDKNGILINKIDIYDDSEFNIFEILNRLKIYFVESKIKKIYVISNKENKELFIKCGFLLSMESTLYLNTSNIFDMQVFYPATINSAMLNSKKYINSINFVINRIEELARINNINISLEHKNNENIKNFILGTKEILASELSNNVYDHEEFPKKIINSSINNKNFLVGDDNEDMIRIFAGSYFLEVSDDNVDDEDILLGKIKANLYITISKSTLLTSVLFEINDFFGNPTIFEDNIFGERAKVSFYFQENSEIKKENIPDFLKDNFGIQVVSEPLFNITSIYDVSLEERKYILSGESSESKAIRSKIVVKEIVDSASKISDIRDFDFCDLFSSRGILYSKLHEKYFLEGEATIYSHQDRFNDKEVWWIVYMEMAVIRTAAIKRTSFKISRSLNNNHKSHTGSHKILLEEYNETIKFRQNKTWKYNVSQITYNKMVDLFEINSMEKHLDNNFNTIDKLVAINTEKSMKIIKFWGTLFASIGTLYGFFSISTIKEYVNKSYGGIPLWVLIVLIVLLVVCFIFLYIIKEKRKLRKRKYL